jgi:hypothetical protein
MKIVHDKFVAGSDVTYLESTFEIIAPSLLPMSIEDLPEELLTKLPGISDYRFRNAYRVLILACVKIPSQTTQGTIS